MFRDDLKPGDLRLRAARRKQMSVATRYELADLLVRLGVPADRVVLIDPRSDASVSVNLLEPQPGSSPEAVVQPLLDVLMRLNREEGNASVWIRTWGAAVLTALSYAGQTLMDVVPFTDIRAQLGHVSEQMTERYAGIPIQAKHDALARMQARKDKAP